MALLPSLFSSAMFQLILYPMPQFLSSRKCTTGTPLSMQVSSRKARLLASTRALRNWKQFPLREWYLSTVLQVDIFEPSFCKSTAPLFRLKSFYLVRIICSFSSLFSFPLIFVFHSIWIQISLNCSIFYKVVLISHQIRDLSWTFKHYYQLSSHF